MAQLRPGLLFTDAFGSAGAVTAYHRGGKCFLRQRVSPSFPATNGQIAAASVHQRALAAWRSLPHEEQLRWEPFARVVEPHRPPFDHKARISGNNLFISAYHGFATLGNEHVPSPAQFETFPTFMGHILGATVIGNDLLLRVQLKVYDPEDRYRLLTKIQLTSPGGGRNPGKMRNFMAERSGNDAAHTARISNYVSIWGLDLPTYQVYARFILLDTRTGYRSQYLAVSGAVTL